MVQQFFFSIKKHVVYFTKLRDGNNISTLHKKIHKAPLYFFLERHTMPIRIFLKEVLLLSRWHMDSKLPTNNYLDRPRINALLKKALEKPLAVIIAGAGYGKSLAVYDFVSKGENPFMWMQLSRLDNVSSRFWESFIHVVAQLGEGLERELAELGFPDTKENLNSFIELRNSFASDQRYILVFDDVHLINNPAVLWFIERQVNETLNGCTTIIICRDLPINIVSLEVKDYVFHINEEDLNFTENELGIYFDQQGLSINPQTLRNIFQDTRGWAFLVNLITQSLKKAPAYLGYTRTAVKQNLFNLMEEEVWNVASDQLKCFWIRLSLIEHLSIDLISMMPSVNEDLLDELMQQSAYVRRDDHIGAYLIHHLFLDFLRTKQGILTDEEKHETYKVAATWCDKNDFLVDAINYYEKVGDYESIVSILFKQYQYLSYDLALHMIEIFERIPVESFIKVDLLAAMHCRILNSLGRWQEAIALAEQYEQQLKKLPEDNILRKHTLCLIYYFWGVLRILMSTTDHHYDFDLYFSKMYDCRTVPPLKMGQMAIVQIGPWGNLAGSAEQGAPHKFIEALQHLFRCLNDCFDHKIYGQNELLQGELMFYQSDISAAEPLFTNAIKHAADYKQFEFMHRSLFYNMRIAVYQGKLTKFESAMKGVEALLSENDYSLRYTTYDIALGWYHYLLRQPEMVPNWLKEKFAPYGHPIVLENFGNQMKARFHYLTKNYRPLLTYIDEMKQRESVLFGRVEMLAIEACVHYQMKDKKAAFDVLRDAYEMASPNNIIMPFIELGKDMRTLTAAAQRDMGLSIPHEWLETINRKSALYAKHQSMIISDYEREYDISSMKALSNRETEVLRDLCNGLSRKEIATKQELSISTVNMNVTHIFQKLEANNLADVIRIATGLKLV